MKLSQSDPIKSIAVFGVDRFQEFEFDRPNFITSAFVSIYFCML